MDDFKKKYPNGFRIEDAHKSVAKQRRESKSWYELHKGHDEVNAEFKDLFKVITAQTNKASEHLQHATNCLTELKNAINGNY